MTAHVVSKIQVSSLSRGLSPSDLRAPNSLHFTCIVGITTDAHPTILNYVTGFSPTLLMTHIRHFGEWPLIASPSPIGQPSPPSSIAPLKPNSLYHLAYPVIGIS